MLPLLHTSTSGVCSLVCRSLASSRGIHAAAAALAAESVESSASSVTAGTSGSQDAGPSQHAAAAFDSSSSSSEAAIQHQQQQPSTQQLQASSPPQPLQQQQQQDAPSSLLHQQVLFEMPPAGQPLPRLPRFRPRKAQQQPVPVMEALSMVKSSAGRPHSTIETHMRLKVDPRRGDQMVRGAAVLPHSWQTGLRIAVFAEGAAADEARAAGADIVGAGELVASILDSKGKSIDFSACLATPDMMPQMVKLGRILGPKGLMPNPKIGTLTDNLTGAIAELRQGRVEFKMDRTGIVHAPIGKASFEQHDLLLNLGALTGALLAVKPEAIKGGLVKYVRTVYLASTMGPSVPVEVASLNEAVAAAAAAAAAGRQQPA